VASGYARINARDERLAPWSRADPTYVGSRTYAGREASTEEQWEYNNPARVGVRSRPDERFRVAPDDCRLL
jgi:hypothetical protein